MKDSPSAQLAQVFLECRQKPRLLVVEDSIEDLEQIQKLILETGCEMCATRSGDEAIRLIMAGASLFDAAILDLTLPGVTGVDVLRFIKDNCPTLSVVIVTGSQGDSPLLLEAIKIGVVTIKTKPVSKQDVLDILEHLNLAPPPTVPPIITVPGMNPSTFLKILFFGVTLILFTAGCSYLAKKKAGVESQQEELLRENNQAADIANQRGRSELVASNFPGALVAYDLSDVMLRRNQSIIGLPVRDQAPRVTGLLGEDEDYLKDELKRVRQEEELKIQENTTKERLYLRGQIAEEKHNKGVIRKFWSWFTGLGVIGMIVAVCVFFPVALPIIGRIIGWLVGKLPSLAGYAGAVSTNAVDRIYRGIEKTKVEQGEDDKTIRVLRANLGESMDEDQKDLIDHRRKNVVVKVEPKVTVVNERADPDIQQ